MASIVQIPELSYAYAYTEQWEWNSIGYMTEAYALKTHMKAMLQIQARGGKSPININKHLSCEDLAPCRGMRGLGLDRGFDSWVFWCRASGNTAYWAMLLLVYVEPRVLLLVYVGPREHTLLDTVVGLCGASGNTPYWILSSIYAGARATHFSGYCCWFMWGLGQHTLLDIIVSLHGGSGNTLYWVLLLVYVGLRATHFTLLLIYVGPRATHFTGYCCWFMWGLWQHTLLLLGYTKFQTTHFTGHHCSSVMGLQQWV
jgi:hypothetical protein